LSVIPLATGDEVMIKFWKVKVRC